MSRSLGWSEALQGHTVRGEGKVCRQGGLRETKAGATRTAGLLHLLSFNEDQTLLAGTVHDAMGLLGEVRQTHSSLKAGVLEGVHNHERRFKFLMGFLYS